MLATVVESNGLKPYLDKVVTIEDVRLFKTAPQAYELLLTAFSVKKEEILFVSSNAWDALAAKWYGFDVFWVWSCSNCGEESEFETYSELEEFVDEQNKKTDQEGCLQCCDEVEEEFEVTA